MKNFWKILFALSLSFSAVSAHAVFNPILSNEQKGSWQIRYVGQTEFNGLPVMVTLEEAPQPIAAQPNPGLHINSETVSVGDKVIIKTEDKAYRLALRLVQQPDLRVFYAMNKSLAQDSAGHPEVRYLSAPRADSQFTFTVVGQEGDTLTVSYVRNQGTTIAETGTFELQPANILQ